MSIVSILIQPFDNGSVGKNALSDGRLNPLPVEIRAARKQVNLLVNQSWRDGVPADRKRILKVVSGELPCVALDQVLFGAPGNGNASLQTSHPVGSVVPHAGNGRRELLPFPTCLSRSPVPAREGIRSRPGVNGVQLVPTAGRDAAYARLDTLKSRSEAEALRTGCGYIAYVLPHADFAPMAKLLGHSSQAGAKADTKIQPRNPRALHIAAFTPARPYLLYGEHPSPGALPVAFDVHHGRAGSPDAGVPCARTKPGYGLHSLRRQARMRSRLVAEPS